MTHDNATPRPWKMDDKTKVFQQLALGGIAIKSYKREYDEYCAFAQMSGTDKEEAYANASLIVLAVNSHDELLSALKRLMLTEGSGSHNETLCYCDDYRKPEICQFCQATQAIAKASIK